MHVRRYVAAEGRNADALYGTSKGRLNRCNLNVFRHGASLTLRQNHVRPVRRHVDLALVSRSRVPWFLFGVNDGVARLIHVRMQVLEECKALVPLLFPLRVVAHQCRGIVDEVIDRCTNKGVARAAGTRGVVGKTARMPLIHSTSSSMVVGLHLPEQCQSL